MVQAYGHELEEAYEWCNKYRVSRKEAELHQAWDLYYHVFKRINKQLPSLTVLEVQYVAPALVRAQVCLCVCAGHICYAVRYVRACVVLGPEACRGLSGGPEGVEVLQGWGMI